MADEKIGGIYYTVEAKTNALLVAQQEVNASTTTMQKDFDKTDKSVNSLSASFCSLSDLQVVINAAKT